MSDNLVKESKNIKEKSKSSILDKCKFFMVIDLVWH